MADDDNQGDEQKPDDNGVHFTTAAEKHGIVERVEGEVIDGVDKAIGLVNRGLSFVQGLEVIPGSSAPSMADGTMVPHVRGPGQAPVDPIAAGIDLTKAPLSRAENRVITQTGEMAAGPRPATYAHVVGGREVPQAAPADGAEVPAKPDSESAAIAGPSS